MSTYSGRVGTYSYFGSDPFLTTEAFLEPVGTGSFLGAVGGTNPFAPAPLLAPAPPLAPVAAVDPFLAPARFYPLEAALLFDDRFYFAAYPAVAAPRVDPLGHYAAVGWLEGRNPNAFFDPAGYLAAYPDVAAARIDPLVHYARWGWLEGRDPSARFDTVDYLSAYPDVYAAGFNPLEHYLRAGAAEGRLAFADGVFG